MLGNDKLSNSESLIEIISDKSVYVLGGKVAGTVAISSYLLALRAMDSRH